MRIIIVANDRNEEVIAEPFEIEGSSEKFAVHRALRADQYRGDYVATHVETSFAVSRADTIDGAIAAARRNWLAATPEQIAEKLAQGHEECQRRLGDGRGRAFQ